MRTLWSFVCYNSLSVLTGISFLLEKVFHNKWWDYSNLPFNLHGYICLKFSIYWGLACTFIMDIIHPIIYKFITLIPQILGIVLISIGMTVFAVDITITVMTIMKLNKRMKAMDEIAKRINYTYWSTIYFTYIFVPGERHISNSYPRN